MTDPIDLLATPLVDAATELAGANSHEALLERPSDLTRGDYATSLALRLAKPVRRAPRDIAEALREAAAESRYVESVEIAGPGFLNLRVSAAWYAAAVQAALQDGFGGGTAERSLKINVEYVSANPTGRLTIGSARNGAYGDSLARLYAFAGHEVTREYYFNDAGSQVERFARTLQARKRGEPVPEDGYPGEDVAELAARLDLPLDAPLDDYRQAGIEAMFAQIKGSLERFRVHVDVFTNEVELHQGGLVDRALDKVKRGGHTFELDDAVWLRTTDFGDDKDRVLIRRDGTPTYYAADLAYLIHKLERGYDLALYVLGADHHGYTARLRAAASVLGYDPERIDVPLYQMVSISEDGESRKISKRRGDVIFLDDVIEAIGVDAARYFLVQRSHDQPIEIDVELATEKSSKNPVFYVQYAHARIASILRRAAEESGAERVVAASPLDLEALVEPSERALVHRIVSFPGVARAGADMRAPHRVVAYAHELAADYHIFYRDCPVLKAPAPELLRARLALCEATRRTLERCLDLVGVAAPDSM